MSATDDDRGGAQRPEENRTVIIPGGTTPPEAPEPAEPASAPTPADRWESIEAAAALPPTEPPAEPPASAPPGDSAAGAAPPRGATGYQPGSRTYAPMAPRTNGNRVEVGDVLNHIFEVKRFIARGGMGEVFEGVNVSSDERVAIKVMLPALAADPNVVAMFRKEARTLTKLAHPALVQYRVLAQEPQLDVLYIVTEFIDGVNLSDVLGELKPSPADLRALARRLAEGLRAAHTLGAIHRDISPDNVLLGDRRLDRAKVIDFGIAKDLDPTNKTIVGDGFAGKLNYVAPEQLGDFGREVGPWTDVYSLGLVMLAVAQGRDSDMGATLVDAVDRRRAGPDLSAIPSELQPVLRAMLVADPAQRLRSMDAVIAALDGTSIDVSKPAGAAKDAKPPKPPKLPKESKPPKPAPPPGTAEPPALLADRRLWVGGGIGAVLLLVLVIYLMSGGQKPATVADAPKTPAVAAATQPPAERARSAIEGVLPAIGCSWLDIAQVAGDGSGVTLRGVAKDPAAAQARVSQALAGVGLQAASIDFSDVSTIDKGYCDAVDVLRPIRLADGQGLSVKQPSFEEYRDRDGNMGADVILDIDVGPPTNGLAILGIEPPGALEVAIKSRSEFDDTVRNYASFKLVHDTVYRASLHTTHTGISGIGLLTPPKELSADEANLLNRPPAQRDAAWRSAVAAAAAKGGWRAQMVWYRTVDEVPG